MKKLVCLVFFAAMYGVAMYGIEKDFVIHAQHTAEVAGTYIHCDNKVVINNTIMKCRCGNDPVVVLIVYGQVTVYCTQCAHCLTERVPCDS
jgi:hypothetical protein